MSLRFLLWFAWLDLFQHPRARRVALVLILTTVVVVALALALPGLVLGYEQQRLAQLRRDPLALALWLGGQPGAAFTPTELEQFNTAVQAVLPAGALRGCHGYRLLTFDWFDLREPRLSRSVRGRTLAADDPLLQSCRLESGHGFNAANEGGVLVTRRLLQALHAPPGAPPPTLRLRFRANDPTLPVVGVLVQPLPGDLDFILTEAGEKQLRTQHADPLASEVLTGPIPEGWRKLRQLPAPAQEWLDRCEVRWIGPEPQGDDTVWRLAADGPKLRLSQWRGCLEGLLSHMRQLGLAGDPEVVRPRLIGASGPEQDRPTPYTQAVLYLSDLEHLPPAAQAVQALGYQVDLDVVEQVARLGTGIRRALLVLGGLLAVLALLVAGNLYIVQDLRAQQKVVEMGLLKALGMDNAWLRAVVLVEAGLLWLLGLVLGLLLGWAVGGLTASWWRAEEGEPLLGFCVPWELVALLVVGSGLVCLSSAWWASRSARRTAPIRSLSGA